MLNNDLSEVLDLERRRIDAVNAGDAAAIEHLFADDIVQIHANGKIDDKISLMAAERATRRTIEPRTPHVRLYGDIAILTGPAVHHVSAGGSPKQITLLVTQVVARRDGRWLFISVHASLAP